MFEVKPIIKKSKKTGKEYVALEVLFPNGYTKIVFLDKAEEYICKPYAENNI
jgi:hypothetical protein